MTDADDIERLLEGLEFIADAADLADLIQVGYFPLPVGLFGALAHLHRNSVLSRLENGTMKAVKVDGQRCVLVPTNTGEFNRYFEHRKAGRSRGSAPRSAP